MLNNRKQLTTNQSQTKTSIKEENNFQNYKLDNIKEYYEDPDIKLVREEREREWKRMEEEIQKKVALENVKAEIIRNEARLKSKEIDGRKMTFDSNGAVINIKNVNLDKLGLDFLYARLY